MIEIIAKIIFFVIYLCRHLLALLTVISCH